MHQIKRYYFVKQKIIIFNSYNCWEFYLYIKSTNHNKIPVYINFIWKSKFFENHNFQCKKCDQSGFKKKTSKSQTLLYTLITLIILFKFVIYRTNKPEKTWNFLVEKSNRKIHSDRQWQFEWAMTPNPPRTFSRCWRLLAEPCRQTDWKFERGHLAFCIMKSVQVFGRKRTATAVAYCKEGSGLIKLNGTPLEKLASETLKAKLLEPLQIIGEDKLSHLDIRLRVHGGGHVSQIYAIRQAVAKAVVAYYQKYVDEQAKDEIKKLLLGYDRTLLVADPRRMEPKKFGGQGARVRRQMSYR